MELKIKIFGTRQRMEIPQLSYLIHDLGQIASVCYYLELNAIMSITLQNIEVLPISAYST